MKNVRETHNLIINDKRWCTQIITEMKKSSTCTVSQIDFNNRKNRILPNQRYEMNNKKRKKRKC